MDRDRSGVKRFAALALIIALGAAAPSTLIVREQAWTAPSETLAHDLTHAPGECLAQTAPDIEIGRALFRSPNLLGGPVARAGVSCNACHSNGGANARFLLPELTDRAGHADITSEWSSRTRGDGQANPLPIPTLAGVSAHETFGQAREPFLETFVRGVIVEEFQGAPPTDQAMAGLLSYLRALQANACTAQDAAITLDSAAQDVRRAVTAANDADPATARLVLLAAQDMIGRIVERLPAHRFGADRRRFEHLARNLGALRNAADVHAALAAASPGWRARFDAVVSRVAQREDRTYFNETTLRAALAH